MYRVRTDRRADLKALERVDEMLRVYLWYDDISCKYIILNLINGCYFSSIEAVAHLVVALLNISTRRICKYEYHIDKSYNFKVYYIVRIDPHPKSTEVIIGHVFQQKRDITVSL